MRAGGHRCTSQPRSWRSLWHDLSDANLSPPTTSPSRSSSAAWRRRRRRRRRRRSRPCTAAPGAPCGPRPQRRPRGQVVNGFCLNWCAFQPLRFGSFQLSSEPAQPSRVLNQVNGGCTLMYQYVLALKRSHTGTYRVINVGKALSSWYIPVCTMLYYDQLVCYILVCTSTYLDILWSKVHFSTY